MRYEIVILFMSFNKTPGVKEALNRKRPWVLREGNFMDLFYIQWRPQTHRNLTGKHNSLSSASFCVWLKIINASHARSISHITNMKQTLINNCNQNVSSKETNSRHDNVIDSLELQPSCNEVKIPYIVYQHYYQWQNSPFSATAFLRIFCQIASGFHFIWFHNNIFFLQSRLVRVEGYPNLEDQIFIL
jgi:hypothetical protein